MSKHYASDLPLATLRSLVRFAAVSLFIGYIVYQIYLDLTFAARPTQTPEMIGVMVACAINLIINPVFFYCRALWSASTIFARMEKGEAFTPVIFTGLRAMGFSLIWGGLGGVLISPLFNMWRDTGQSNIWSNYSLPVGDLTLGLLGFVLLALSQQGKHLRGELEKFV